MPPGGGGGRTLERLEVHRLVPLLSGVVDEAGLEGVHVVAVLALVSRHVIVVLGQGRLVVNEGRLLLLLLSPPLLNHDERRIATLIESCIWIHSSVEFGEFGIGFE